MWFFLFVSPGKRLGEGAAEAWGAEGRGELGWERSQENVWVSWEEGA